MTDEWILLCKRFWIWRAIAVHGLAKQGDFHRAMFSAFTYFVHDINHGSVLFQPTRKWHDAIRAEFIATSLDGHKGLKLFLIRWHELEIIVSQIRTIRKLWTRLGNPPGQLRHLRGWKIKIYDVR